MDSFDTNPSEVMLNKNVFEEYLNVENWNPECDNFVLIDWEKWEALNPSSPKIFDPPQRKNLKDPLSIPLYWYNRSCYFQPFAVILHKCCSIKPEAERISGDSLFRKMLNPSTVSDHTPAVFRNHLLWTENNIAPETLVSLNSWAWRSQTKESRIVGLGSLQHGWTNDPTCWGWIFSRAQKGRMATIQISPDGKWILLGTFTDNSPEGEMSYHWMYVVQEGDAFETPDGNLIDHVKPGDLVRLTWDTSDPYQCDNSKLSYMYFPRRVASLNKNGTVVRNHPHFDDLLQKVVNQPSIGTQLKTCCFSCSFGMSPEDRFDLQVGHVSDSQVFATAPPPPKAEFIERL